VGSGRRLAIGNFKVAYHYQGDVDGSVEALSRFITEIIYRKEIKLRCS
jgi:hypothetical protein